MYDVLDDSKLNQLQADDNLLTELQLGEYNNQGKLAEFLTFADKHILMAGQEHLPKTLTVINPLPNHHAYQDGIFDVSPMYFGFYDNSYLFNYHGAYESFDELQLMALANYILAFIGLDKRIYDIKGFDINLYSVFDESVATRFGLDLDVKQNINDERPYDLSQIHQDPAFCYMLAHADVFDVPNPKSVSSKDATDWLISQKGRILAWTFSALPDGLQAWQEHDILTRFRLVLNLFIALARHAMRDGRVVDDKYKNYPLMDKLAFDKVVERFTDGHLPENKIVELFLSTELLSVWTWHKQDNDKLKNALMENVV